MATDPRIRYDIAATASGAAEVEKLAREFEQLDGAFPEDLAGKVRQASQQLEQLGQQQAAVEAFTRIKTETEQARRALDDAQAAAQKFGAELAQVEAPTRAQAGQLQKLRDNVRAAKDELLKQTEALDGARAGLTQFGISGDQVGQRSVTLRQQISAVRSEIEQLGTTGRGAAGFQQLVRETDAARQRMEQTAQAAEALAAELARVQRPTDGQTASLRQLQAAAGTARADFVRLQAATVEQGVALRQAGANTELLTARARESAAAQTQAATAAQRVTAAYTEQGAAAARSAQQQAAAGATVRQGLEGIAGQLRSIQALAATVLGGQLLSGQIGDLVRTADAYANLEARIKLVTGEGTALQEAFAGVFDVAQRTNTAVEGTGTLFARIAQSQRDLGASTTEASATALALTETINQAIQVSGGSAQSADAAVTQLIQALQSGVLRGEEFNSVMEQAPRLARALADGLGVTTGELRKLAEQGTLTSTTVIEALRGQSATLQREFEQLPPTVGRALTSLSNEWTRYVGEVDRANGISRTAAEAIQALAQNLDAVGTALAVAGKAVAAYIAIDLAKSLYARAAAAAAAAAAQAKETTATVAATAAITANTAAVAANTAAKGANLAASGAAAASSGLLATSFGLLRGAAGGALAAIGGLPTVLLAVILNARELGTWLGETAAKMLGAKDRSEELAAADRRLAEESRRAAAAKAEQAQRTQQAADAALGLTETSKRLVTEFDGLIKKGESVSDALAKISKNLELGNLQGIRDAVTALDALAQQGKITGEQIRESLAAALKGEDLANFKIQARAAFDESEQGARRFAAALAAIDTEALRRAGTSVEELRTGFSRAAISAVNDVDAIVEAVNRLGLAGEDAQAAIVRALGAATNAAETERAIEAVIEKITLLGKQGTLSGNQLQEAFQKAIDKAIQFADTEAELRKVEQKIKDITAANPEMARAFESSLETLKRKVIEVSPYLRQLQDDAKRLGVTLADSTTQGTEASIRAYERLKLSGKVTTGELQQAFVNLAKEAIAAAGGQIPEWVKVEAAMRGVTVGTDAAGRAFVQMGDAATTAFRSAADGAQSVVASLSSITDAARKAQGSLSTLGSNTYDKDGFATDSNGNRINITGQIPLAEGQSIDMQAFLRAQYYAALTGQAAPDPKNFVVTDPGQVVRNPSSIYGQYAGQSNGGAGYSPFSPQTQQQKKGSSAPSGFASSSPTTVNINVNGQRAGSVNVMSPQDALALEDAIRQLTIGQRSTGQGAGGY